MITWAISPDKLTITSKYVDTSSVELYFSVTVPPDYNHPKAQSGSEQKHCSFKNFCTSHIKYNTS